VYRFGWRAYADGWCLFQKPGVVLMVVLFRLVALVLTVMWLDICTMIGVVLS